MIMNADLQKKVDAAIKLLQSTADIADDIELCYSGGKDSDVILELAKMAGIPFTAIYKNTTIDPPGTLEHVKSVGAEIVQPKRTFFELIEAKGFPTMRARFCCSDLKEYKIKDTAILGIRKEESVKRAKRYKEPIVCRIHNKQDHVNQILPILDWTTQDVIDFIMDRRIKLAPVYYPKDGILGYYGIPDCSIRLGCIGCPLQSNKGVKDFKQYPKMLAKWIEHGKVWWENHPKAKSHKKFSSIYALMAHNIFFKSYSDFQAADTSLFGDTNWKQALETYFNIELP